MKHKVKEFNMTCSVCPSAWEGKLEDGTPFNIRYRWGALTITTNPFTEYGKTIYEETIGDQFDGCMSTKVMKHLTDDIFDWSESIDYSKL